MTVTVPNELRVGLTDRELKGWIESLREGHRKPAHIADEIERARLAALRAGITNRP